MRARRKFAVGVWSMLLVSVPLSLAAQNSNDKDATESVEDQAGMFLMTGKREVLNAMKGLADLSTAQSGKRGVTSEQRKCLKEFASEMRKQTYKLVSETDDVDYKSFAELRKNDARKARKQAEEIVELRDSIGKAIRESYREQNDCLFGEGNW